MRTEIERKFLVANDGWRADAVDRRTLRDGLLCLDGRGKVRIRLDGTRAWLTVKGPRLGLSRTEYDYEIPSADAESLLTEHCLHDPIEKVRHRVPRDGLIWEIDVYGGILAGLVMAEVELTHEEQAFTRPLWLGAEVSTDPAYRQSTLAKRVRRPHAATRVEAANMGGGAAE